MKPPGRHPAHTRALPHIIRAIDVLNLNPLIGQPVRADLRELVIGRHARGYVALYRYVAELVMVFVLAIRGQNEAGYTRT
jgi:plasmid stabilization system protein ParE